jgi:quinoprotein dehydrogenase-associated probable ABC transporter substrate-binding protein
MDSGTGRRRDRRSAAAAYTSAGWIAAGLVFGLICSGAGGALAQTRPDLVTPNVLRVCADPANLPFSNREGEGFENRIAAILADELKLGLRYYWLPSGPGFVRNTLGLKLCDVIIGYISGASVVQNTNPYYRSTYAVLFRKGGPLQGLETLSDPRLKSGRVGVVAATPAVDHLAENGLLAESKFYALLVDRRYDSPADAMARDLLGGEIVAGILWGPLAGDVVRRHPDLALVPLLHESGRPPLAYRITLGIRPDELQWKHNLNDALRRRRAEITRVLLDYGVPLLDEEDRPITSAEAARP